MTNPESEHSESPESKITILNPARSAEDWKQETIRILKTRRAQYVLAGLGFLVIARVGTNWWSHRRIAAVSPTVEVTSPVVKSLDTSLTLPGNVEAIEQASLFAHVSGYLKKIYVDEGDTVKKGQLLAEIDAPDIVQEYRKAKAEYELKKITRDRYKELLNEQVVSEQEFENVDADAEESKARFDNAAANLAYTHIIAPFDGAIARRYKYPGDLIAASAKGTSESPIFMLVNESTLRIVIHVPQVDLANIHVDHPVDIHVDSLPNEAFHGTVSRLDALLNSSTDTQRVLIDIPNPKQELHAGMFCSVVLHLDHKDGALTVPKEAVQDDGGKPFVFIVKDKKAFKRPVSLGLSDSDSVEVVQGIGPKDQVVLHGGELLQDGAKVEIRKSSTEKM